jgi:multiple sugar transport system permease protein
MGGPAQATFVVSILSYFTAFYRFNLGYASAMSTIMLFIMMIWAVGYIKIISHNED